jgi:DNA mismatch repair protein MutS2
MDAHTIRVLEFGKVLSLVARYTSGQVGRDCVLGLEPLDDPDQIDSRLDMIGEMKALIEWEKSPPLSDVPPAGPVLARTRVPGAVLEASSLQEVASLAACARSVRRFLDQQSKVAPGLWNLASGLRELRDLEKKIGAAIDDDTSIKDGASPRLKKIRQEKTRISSRLDSVLSAMLARSDVQKHLREGLVTLRNGRYVIPVTAASRGRIEGIVHDTSQSGQTVFIEPMATVELNNTLRSLELEEKDEIVRILAELTDAVASRAGELSVDLEILTQIDVILAGARFAVEYGCSRPGLNTEGRTVIKAGRHPLLVETFRKAGGDQAVPLDVSVGEDYRALLITGPNAGGKTVALKTIGVLTLLTRTGFWVPCGDGTEIGLYRKVYVDIGDEQSIELSLSTFSSHMKNIIGILEKSGPDTLVLLDEVGAGTDPSEGAALARTLIEDLVDRGATLVATTHHMSLKVFAHDHSLLENASMEFDSGDLRPTYRLIQGIPGASHAFEIAARLGLGAGLLERARTYCGEERVRFEELTRDLLERIRRIRSEEATLDGKRRKADQVLAEYEERLARVEEYDRQVRKEALKEARSVVEEARRRVKEMVRDLRKREHRPEEAHRVEKEIRHESSRLREEIDRIEASEEVGEPLGEIALGARVFVRPLGKDGMILSEPDARGRVEVVVGALKIQVDSGDLYAPREKAPRPQKGGVEFEPKEVPSEISVRGMTAEEALEAVDKYLDDAILCGYSTVKIVHGKGMGILSRRIAELLAGHPRVEGHRLGGLGEGGTGVTFVKLAKG